MASFEDYDEFGNYIGADLDSDEEEDDIPQTESTFAAPLEGFDDEPAEPMALMEVDGISLPLIWHSSTNIVCIPRAFAQGCYSPRR